MSNGFVAPSSLNWRVLRVVCWLCVCVLALVLAWLGLDLWSRLSAVDGPKIDLVQFWEWLGSGGANGERWESAATTIGFVVGIFGVLIALATYRRGAADAAAAHMHGLFREYLKGRDGGGAKNHASDDAVSGHSFHLYTLEEMVIWLDRQWWPQSRLSFDDRRAWRRTIAKHLFKNLDAVEHLVESTDSYGKPFLYFVLEEGRARRGGADNDLKRISDAMDELAKRVAHRTTASDQIRRQSGRALHWVGGRLYALDLVLGGGGATRPCETSAAPAPGPPPPAETQTR